jgi:hypothetical protein
MSKNDGHVYDKKRKHCLNVPGKGMLADQPKRGKLFDENDYDEEDLELLYKIK